MSVPSGTTAKLTHTSPKAPDQELAQTFSLQTASYDLTENIALESKAVIPISFARGPHSELWLGDLVIPSTSSSIKVKVALKLLRGPVYADIDEMENIKSRIKAKLDQWTSLFHPSVLRIHGICSPFVVPDRSPLPSLVCEYCPNGNLPEYIAECGDVDRIRLLSEAASGLAYLHQMGITHGDIKPANILVDASGRAVLTDFGLYQVYKLSNRTTEGIGGSSRYLAPELFVFDAENESFPLLTEPCDVWSLSLTALQILSGRLPFPCIVRDISVAVAVSRGVRPSVDDYPGVPPGVWHILSTCWVELEGRISAAGLADLLKQHQVDG